MGCKESKQGDVDGLVKNMDLPNTDRSVKFEQMLPFPKMKIEILEHKVKSECPHKQSLSREDLINAFSDDKNWADLAKDNSLLVQVLTSEYFRDEENPNEINKNALMIFGLMLSGGDAKMKARVLYDVL